ncbi:MAG: trypsin-like peptidase domain-containing protein [bacterium]|nr:trypsin-like peptidase domain-containing protein [bacterium]
MNPCSIRHRILAIVILAFAGTTLGQESVLQEWSEQFTEWKDRSGQFTVQARLLKQDKDTVTLESPTKEVVQVAKAKLDVAKAKKVHLAWLRSQDIKQLELSLPHIARISETPEAVAELLLVLHREYSTAPYAGLFAGTIFSWASNESLKGKIILEQVIKRIESQRNFDVDAHGETLNAARNNLAVLQIKLGNSASAAALLTDVCNEGGETPLATYHNATYLCEAGRKLPFTLPAANIGSLLRAVGSSQGHKDARGLEDKFAYWFDFTVPIHSPGKKEKPVELNHDPSIPSNHVYYGHGSGFCIGPGLILTNRHVAKGEDGSKLQLRVMTGEKPPFQSFPVSEVVLPQNRDLDLALLHVEGLNLPPLRFADKAPKQGAAIRILGFPIGGTYGFAKFMTNGTINATAAVGSSLPSLITDGQIDAGNSGGPAVDLFGSVVGIAFAESVVKEEYGRGRGLLVNPEDAVQWIREKHPSLPLIQASEPTFQDWEAVYAETSPSVVLIERYVDRDFVIDKRTQQTNASPRDLNAAQLGMFFDPWCLFCSGKGFSTCVRGCTNGGIRRVIRVQVGFNRVNNTPIYGSKTVYDPCPTCSGSGKQRCKHCENGRW